MAGKALVLGGGGVTGIAWELGILAGLAEDGVDLTDADVVVGTSAGSVVGAQLTSGIPVEELYQRQLEPPTGEIAAKIKLSVLARWAMASLGTRDPQRARARIGAMALAARTGPEEARREVFEHRLSIREWPTHPKLLVTAIAADDGEFVVWDRDSGVSLVDAVMSSCAVPGVWPPVTINGRRYIDGGMRAPANVDVAAGCDRLVVIAPLLAGFRRDGRVATQVSAMGVRRVAVVSPDKQAAAAIGRNVLDPSRREASARAGHDQARRVIADIVAAWKD
jgi:NTE family protein